MITVPASIPVGPKKVRELAARRDGLRVGVGAHLRLFELNAVHAQTGMLFAKA